MTKLFSVSVAVSTRTLLPKMYITCLTFAERFQPWSKMKNFSAYDALGFQKTPYFCFFFSFKKSLEHFMLYFRNMHFKKFNSKLTRVEFLGPSLTLCGP